MGQERPAGTLSFLYSFNSTGDHVCLYLPLHLSDQGLGNYDNQPVPAQVTALSGVPIRSLAVGPDCSAVVSGTRAKRIPLMSTTLAGSPRGGYLDRGGTGLFLGA